ncbi:MAG: hypothetical protein KGK10_00270 [Rhodospirillales bacterium]|jgi:hypothetical protein|nr:hypothetical protein [Rhodospirillales bacterium]
MLAFDHHRELLLAAIPLIGAVIVVKGTGLGAVVDTVVTICAMLALLSFAHIIDIPAFFASF